MIKIRVLLGLLVAAIGINGLCLPAQAQAPTEPTPQARAAAEKELENRIAALKPATSVELDLSIPASPAFVVLGVTPENVIRPSTPRALATSLLNSIDQNGNLQTGFAIDSAPFRSGTTLAKYRENSLARLLANTQVSLASIKGQDEADKSVRLALGLHTTILGKKGDPRRDDALLDKLREFVLRLPVDPSVPAQDIDDQIANAEFPQRILREFYKKAEKERVWIFAIAPSWISESGDTSDLTWNGLGFWTSYGFGLGKSAQSQLIFHVRHRTNEQVADEDNPDEFVSQDTTLIGARLRMGSTNFRYSLEAGYLRKKVTGEDSHSSVVYTLVMEPRVRENLWLHVAFQAKSNSQNGSDVGLRTDLKWGFNIR